MTTQPAAEPAALLLPKQVRDRLRVSDRTLFRYAAAGKLRPVHLPGGQRRFRCTDVDQVAGVDDDHDCRDQAGRPGRCEVCLVDHGDADCPQGVLL